MTSVQYSGRLTEALNTVVNRVVPPAAGSGAKPKAQYTNANQAVFFEAVNLIAHYDSDASLELKAAKQLGSFFQENKPNVRLLALEGLSIMAQTIHARPAVKEHLPGVLALLHESKDPNVQRRAVNVLYGVCDSDSVIAIVKDLLRFLKGSDYGVREEVVLKCAILAEKFAADYKWYVNVVLTLITLAGDHVAEEVWHRVLQVVVNRDQVPTHPSHLIAKPSRLTAAQTTIQPGTGEAYRERVSLPMPKVRTASRGANPTSEKQSGQKGAGTQTITFCSRLGWVALEAVVLESRWTPHLDQHHRGHHQRHRHCHRHHQHRQAPHRL